MAEEQAKSSGLPKLVNDKFTKSFNAESTPRKWLLVDATDQSVGRLATQIASFLRGKHKPQFTPHGDAGDFVVVINAEKVQLRGNDKLGKKTYFKHTGYRGNLKSKSARDLLADDPIKVLEIAVFGMVPRGALGNQMMKSLKIYAGADHPHKAQKPEPVKIGNLGGHVR